MPFKYTVNMKSKIFYLYICIYTALLAANNFFCFSIAVALVVVMFIGIKEKIILYDSEYMMRSELCQSKK
jgi:hypothetical protein